MSSKTRVSIFEKKNIKIWMQIKQETIKLSALVLIFKVWSELLWEIEKLAGENWLHGKPMGYGINAIQGVLKPPPG
jgi:hypothetical protein